MERFINKLESRFGKYAVHDLIKYLMMIYCAGAAIGLLTQMGAIPDIYDMFLSLNVQKIMHGQVWRIFTYLIEPYGFTSIGGAGIIIDIIFFLFQVGCFFLFGRSLENAWGAFRFNLYFIFGWFLNIAAAFIMYFTPLHPASYQSGFQYIYWSMFFAFAYLYPDVKLALYGIIPIKVKWLAYLDGLFLAYQIIANLMNGIKFMAAGGIYKAYASVYFSAALAVIVSLLNFFIFFSLEYKKRHGSFTERQRRKAFNAKTARQGKMPLHRCAICGRTELDDPNLTFRYCSKCNGNYEYCQDHLFTHRHVQ
ncbi:MAG: hypothetical protein VZR00_02840 [Lachnospiraceae bacterium]|jgi:hypothetical protein|nr:hypothetical protein [Lachnospiraceae bacterium]MEE3460813.1 hypothetical protein [Lachnospiraceae bacterium]